VLDERLPCVGQPDAAAAAVDEHGPGALLERRDLLGDGRLGVGERVSRGGERAVLGHRAEHAKLLHVEHRTPA
jgi:hypothetical protein